MASLKKRMESKPESKPKNKGGRPTALTPDVQDKIVSAVRAGNYIETAAAHAGIHKDSLYEWLKRGAKGEEPFAAFSDALQKALGDSEARDVAIIGRAAETQWQAAAWRLERKHPERWGRRDRLALEGGDKPVRLEVVYIDSWRKAGGATARRAVGDQADNPAPTVPVPTADAAKPKPV